MKVSINANDLKQMIKTAGKYTDKTGILAGIVALSVHDGRFEVIVVAKTTVLRQWVEAGPVYNDDFMLVPAEDGFYVASLKDLAPIEGLEKGSEVTIEAQAGTVSIISPSHTFDVRTALDPAEFPDFSDPKGDIAETLEIVPSGCECFKYIIPALSMDISMPAFRGAALKDGALVATDGYRLHYCPVPALFGTGTLTGIIAPELLRFIADGHGGTFTEYLETKTRKEKREVITETMAAWHALKGPGFSFTSRPISGQFPDFFKVMPRYNSYDVATVDAKTLMKAIKPLYSGWEVCLCMKFSNSTDGVKLECAGRPGEKAEQPPNRTGILKGVTLPNLPVCLNPQYVTDALNGNRGIVNICIENAENPVWVGEFDGLKYGRGAIIMPLEPL